VPLNLPWPAAAAAAVCLLLLVCSHLVLLGADSSKTWSTGTNGFTAACADLCALQLAMGSSALQPHSP
jgi:hypothetical protein